MSKRLTVFDGVMAKIAKVQGDALNNSRPHAPTFKMGITCFISQYNTSTLFVRVLVKNIQFAKNVEPKI